MDSDAFSLRSPAASGNSLTNSLDWFATRPYPGEGLKPWPVEQPIQGKSANLDNLGPIRKFGRHGVRMNNRCLKLSDVACPNVPSIRCIGDSCCPDGSLCPSAPFYSNPICQSPKKVACRGTDGHNPAIKKKNGKKAGPCPVGSPVFCPNTILLCEKNQCCPDGSLCPSADASTANSCQKDKVHDCTGGQTHMKKQKSYAKLEECKAGDEVTCPDSDLKCWGSMCCSDGRPCPSASKTVKCWKEKVVDCLPKEAPPPEPEHSERFEERRHDAYRERSRHDAYRERSRYSEEAPTSASVFDDWDANKAVDPEAEEDFESSEADAQRPQPTHPKPEAQESTDSVHSDAECDESKKCMMGASVLCPDKKSRCAGTGCCPDGSLCPSAPPLVPGTSGCQKEKAYDCTCLPKVSMVGHATCLLGASVRCPGHKPVNCSGASCCPDGSTCPSAPVGTLCSLPKKKDCTGQTLMGKYAAPELGFQSDLTHSNAPTWGAIGTAVVISAVALVALKGRKGRDGAAYGRVTAQFDSEA